MLAYVGGAVVIKSYYQSDIGLKRQLNEDCVFTSDSPIGNLPNFYVVCDGMGGHNAGEQASAYAIEVLKQDVCECPGRNAVMLMEHGIKKANEMVIKKSNEIPECAGMGTTIVCCSITDDLLQVANVGDSRLYVIGEEITQITTDHSLVEEMVKLGGLDRGAAKNHPRRNIITRAVGAANTIEADFFHVDLHAGELILLCSDGLTNMVEDETIAAIIQSEDTLQGKVERLVNEANRNGGQDNISVILIDPFSSN